MLLLRAFLFDRMYYAEGLRSSYVTLIYKNCISLTCKGSKADCILKTLEELTQVYFPVKVHLLTQAVAAHLNTTDRHVQQRGNILGG